MFNAGWPSFNLLQFAWVMFWVRSHFILAEIVAVINFLQLVMLYLRNPTTPRYAFSGPASKVRALTGEYLYRLVHLPVAALPLTWSFFLVLWNGAVAVCPPS